MSIIAANLNVESVCTKATTHHKRTRKKKHTANERNIAVHSLEIIQNNIEHTFKPLNTTSSRCKSKVNSVCLLFFLFFLSLLLLFCFIQKPTRIKCAKQKKNSWTKKKEKKKKKRTAKQQTLTSTPPTTANTSTRRQSNYILYAIFQEKNNHISFSLGL